MSKYENTNMKVAYYPLVTQVLMLHHIYNVRSNLPTEQAVFIVDIIVVTH